MEQARNTLISVTTYPKRNSLAHSHLAQLIIKLLLKYRANVTVASEDLMTFLHTQCSIGRFVEPILSFSVDPKMLDFLDRTLPVAPLRQHNFVICGNAGLPFL